MDFLRQIRDLEGPPPDLDSPGDVLAPYFRSFQAFCEQAELDLDQALDAAREAESDAIRGGDTRQEIRAMYVRLRLENQMAGRI